LIRRQQFDFEQELGKTLDELAFAAYDVERIEALPLLFQTGYLTIKSSSQSRGGGRVTGSASRTARWRPPSTPTCWRNTGRRERYHE